MNYGFGNYYVYQCGNSNYHNGSSCIDRDDNNNNDSNNNDSNNNDNNNSNNNNYKNNRGNNNES